MTLYVPLDLKSEHSNSPPFLVASPTPEGHLTAAVQSILKAKRIAVVCGAGISVGAGIPDFRSQDGLFQSLKRDNPKESLSSGKDLFDASVFKSTQKTALFYRMIASLASLSSQGKPTVFHQLLRTLDERGQLLRVYTQNIDALEMKAGLSFGVPEFEEKKLRVMLKGKAKVKAKQAGIGAYSAKHGSGRGKQPLQDAAVPPSLADVSSVTGPSSPPRSGMSPSPNLPTLPAKPYLNMIPRCIPLHGTLLTLHCPHCTQTFPLEPPSPNSIIPMSPPPSPTSSSYKPPSSSPSPSLHSLLAEGTPPPCPSCASLEQTRALVGKRLRGVGKLRPSVVLYGEEHREGEGVGEAVRRDLCGIPDAKGASSSGTPDKDKPELASPTKSRLRAGKGPDLLLVVGTSLRVPGTKRIVREFSKAVRPSQSPSPSRMPTPTPSPPAGESKSEPIRTIYLNNEFPLTSREWEGVFDVWVDGDVQTFAKMAGAVIREHEEKQERKKRKAAAAKEQPAASDVPGTVKPTPTPSKEKRKPDAPCEAVTPSKRYKPEVVIIPPTPLSLPRPAKSVAFTEAPRLFSQISPSKLPKPSLQLSPPKSFKVAAAPNAPQLTLQYSPHRSANDSTVGNTQEHTSLIFPSPKLLKVATISEASPLIPPPPRRRVILRLPPPPDSAPPTPPRPPKRKRSPLSVSVAHKPSIFARSMARSLSPLTSLSSISSRNSLSPPPSPISRDSTSSSSTVSLWRNGLDMDSRTIPRSVNHRHLGQSDDDDIPLSKSFPSGGPLRRGAEDKFSNRVGSWQLPVYA